MKKVKLKLPKARDREETDIFVGVNGVGYRIQKGVEVEVSEAVAEVLRNAERAEDENEAFVLENRDKSDQ